MLVLGIEATAHTFGVGIVDAKNKKVLFNEKSQYKDVEGMDLRKLSEFHVSNFDSILVLARDFLIFNGYNGFNDIDLISFSRGPGIGNSLKIGALAAKTLAIKYNKPIVGANHIKAHLEIGKMLTGFKDPLFLYVSGVNTQIIAEDEFGKYKIYGETEDIGLGNLIDSFARFVGLDFPGGPKIEKLALKSSNYIDLPFCVKGMNVSLAGMFSSLKQQFEKGASIEDLSYSLQETAFASMMEVVERAMAYTKKKEFVIVGGVASNKRLTFMAKEMCKIRGAIYDSFPMEFAMDNGAMIAWQGYLDYKKQNKKTKTNTNKKQNSSKELIKDLMPLPYINIESDV
ncbi:MAG: tRNA (adenosine(37)-N6)-threonylcarbamoyltransferase complex transferase subunit TsaD [Nanoarchaeota archaeon]|nr:tRNA (adenosine(37)-N6)-threonylcarbamoyltransferase complex transferase subunit TsaD [Nanoarchaeota archaeon]